MQIGRYTIEQLSEGVFEVFEDGVIQKAESTEKPPSGLPKKLGKQPVSIGINPVLVSDGKRHVLIDAGLGWGLDHKSNYINTSNLLTNLDIFGLTPDDITHVVLSHLHYDHAAGSTFVDDTATTRPTMGNAHYFIQKKEWYYALEQMSGGQHTSGARYNLDEMYKLVAEDKLVMITDKVFELLPGIQIIKTGGHTPGHQIVKIQDAGETAYFLGDLVPSEYHLNHYAMRQLDFDPVQSKKAKTLILRQALKENALMLFYHSIHAKTGKLERDKDKKFVLRK